MAAPPEKQRAPLGERTMEINVCRFLATLFGSQNVAQPRQRLAVSVSSHTVILAVKAILVVGT